MEIQTSSSPYSEVFYDFYQSLAPGIQPSYGRYLLDYKLSGNKIDSILRDLLSSSFKFRIKDKSGNWINYSSESESELRNELRSYLSLKENWDGEGAKIPTQESVNDALKFLDNRPDNIPLPYPEEGFDGDAGLYWRNRKAQVFAEVTFDGDNKFSFLLYMALQKK